MLQLQVGPLQTPPLEWMTMTSGRGGGSAHLVVGAEVQQPPRRVHEVREVVQESEASPDRLDADLLQPAVLRRHGQGEAQLEGDG